MQREMRRKDKALSDPREVEAILRGASVLHLGLCRGDEPYVVPMNYGYADGRIYLHGGPGGLKFEMLAANPRVSFAVETGVELVPSSDPCDWSVRYRSVIGLGTAKFLETPEEKARGLNAITAHLGAGSHTWPPQALARVTVVEITVEHLTGRQAGYP